MKLKNNEHQEILEKLREPIPYKWRAQQVTEWGANCVAYIDARDAQQRLDDVFGLNWSSEFIPRQVDGQTRMFCRITVTFPDGTKIWREDTGTESTTEKEKGEVSDAFKRAAVNFGVGRFLYSLGTVRVKQVTKNKKGKWVPGENGYQWSAQKLTDYCNSQVKGPKEKQKKQQQHKKDDSQTNDLVKKIIAVGKNLMSEGLPPGKLTAFLGGHDWKNQDAKALHKLLKELSDKKVDDFN